MTTAIYQPTQTALSNLFHAQEKLDHVIENKFPRGDEDRLELKILALLTEVGEALNEFREFKFWSQDRKRREGKLIPELVDIFHFLLSIGIEIGHTDLDIFVLYEAESPLEAFGEMYLKANNLLFSRLYNLEVDHVSLELAFAAYYQLLERLGYTWHDIELAYNRKNEENHTRQETAY